MKDLLEQAAKRAQELHAPVKYIHCNTEMVDEIKKAVYGSGIKVIGYPYIEKTTAYLVKEPIADYLVVADD